MVFSYTCLTLQRVVLPFILVLAALYRPVGISFVYLLMFFISPFVPVATKQTFKGSVTPYLIILIALSTILLLCHIGLQVSILALKIDDQFGTCTVIERLLRHVGFIGFKNLKVIAIIEWLVPEVAVFITSIAVYTLTKKITQKVEVSVENGNVDVEGTLETGDAAADIELSSVKVNNDVASKQQLENNNKPNFDSVIKISPLFCLATLFFSAVLRPSVPGGFYFLIFLLSGSYWATFKSLQRKFAILLRLVMVVIMVHTICIVAYQTPWMQIHLDKTSLTARLIGLEPLVTSTCANDIRIIVYDTQFKADSFLNPIVLFFTYYVFSLTSKNLIKARVTLRRDQQCPQIITEATETTPLMRSATNKSSTTNDNNSGVTSQQQQQQQQPNNDVRLGSTESGHRYADMEYKTGICDQVWYGITGIGGFIYQNSYIFTNVLMMAWSIVYHSWLTFVLLLWANVLWMIPNQRKAMMRSSPFIVIYAGLLLIAQYIYGMDLTNDELPTKVNISGINLNQIGFQRPQEHDMQPCIPLIVKTAFLLMFWVTLRQFFKEKTDKRRDSTLADIFAPLQLGVGHSIGDQTQVGGKKTSKFLKKMGIVIKNLLVRLWIWLLVLVIFLCAMTGEKMTGFRICYMALFLFFLLVFQSSSKAWVKLMYGFWLFLIFYAMSILTLIYTYQFDKFDNYWEEYLNISTTLQTDIGLQRYKTKDLFLHLVSPTIIVILTVIQVHYFHKRFVASINQPTELVKRSSEERTRHKSRTTSRANEMEGMVFVESAGNLIRLFLKRCLAKAEVFFKHFKGVIWRLLELHWIKVVYITAFICAVSEVSLLNIPFVALCVLGVVSNTRMQFFFSRLISLVVTIIVLSKMIYQIAYLDHHQYDNKCPNYNRNITGNNAEWFGLYKASAEFRLMDLLKPYIIYMVIATLHAVIVLRQYQMRRLKGIEHDPLPKVVFPDVSREDAEKKLSGMTKFLLNYGFYKFGYEICMIALVSTITYRQDVVALAYAVWLVLLLLFKRMKNAHIWGIFQMFILVSILVQYVVVVQFPPSICMEYLWIDSEYSEALQRWAMLPGPLNYNHTDKLIFDFVLLLLVNRQRRVFTLESNPNYPGGSNKSAIKYISSLGKIDFENPTHNFLSHIRNYSDIFKHAVLCGFYWVTLAVVFLAGTNILDFLALGYLIGAFIFLWEGSDFYLRPIHSITARWKWLLAYNVANIVLKTFLQMFGCLFTNTLNSKFCWAVHFFGIGCSSKGVITNITSDPANECPALAVESMLLWDATCFAFLIFQLRIFKSYYFCHIVTDTRANNILASRGAEIIERLRQNQIEKRQDHEEEVLHKIKRKMEKIRATQQKMLRPLEKPTHFDEHGNPVYSSRPHKRKEIKLHPQAVRAGDYYMFEDIDDKFELEVISNNEGLFDTDNENITESEIKMNRRKTLYDESFKPKIGKDSETDEGPSTSKVSKLPSRAHIGETKPKTEVDSGDTIEDSDADLEANPIIRLMEGFLVSLTIRLNRFSRNYRYVNKILAQEKKALKESNNMYMFNRRFNAKNAASIFSIIKRKIATSDESDDPAAPSTSSKRNSNNALNNIPNIQEMPPQNNHNTYEPMQSQINPQTPLPISQPPLSTTATTSTIQSSDIQLYNDEAIDSLDVVDARSTESNMDQNIQTVRHGRKSEPLPEIRIKAPSFDRGHRGSSSVISKQWSQEKVTSTETAFDDEDFTARDHNIMVEVLISAWFAILSNTDLVCYIVVFINQVVNASLISLPLPLMVFLWGTLSLPRPTKTFWVTLIAYTQAIVLIKCIFQYKLIWINYQYNLPNNPLAVEKLFGVAMSADFATYDLLLLFVLFFHRFFLKSHGLWKTDIYKPIVTYTEDDYDSKSVLEFKPKKDKAINTEPYSSSSSDSMNEEGPIRSYKKVKKNLKKKSRKVHNRNSFTKTDSELSSTSVSDKVSFDREYMSSTEFSSSQDDGNINIRNDSNPDDEDVNVNERRHSGGSERVAEHRLSISHNDIVKRVESLQRSKYMSGLTKFFHNLTHKSRLSSDVYALMFLCDFINFFVLLFGFSAFSSKQTDGGVQTYLAENKVPIPFLIMLLVQFGSIVIDRALYLRKALVGKIIFHFFSVVGIHIWMFFIVPAVTERSFYSSAPPIIFYIIKCFYFLLSSYQIRCGYPNRILGNFLTRSFSLINMISFKIYMLIPFLYELRTILDWLCTDTTMTLFDWLKMEDIFANNYSIKCLRQMETDFPAIRAQKKPTYMKLLLGGCAILLIVFALWGPLTLFALSGAVGQSNVPTQVEVSIRIGSYEPIYEANTLESTFVFNEDMFLAMKNAYIKDKDALSFLLSYDASDIAAIKLKRNSPSVWNIAPPDKARLLAELESNVTLTMGLTYKLTRIPPVKNQVGTVTIENTWQMTGDYPERKNLANMISTGNENDIDVSIPFILPTFIKVLNSANPSIISDLMPKFNTTNWSDFTNMSISMNSAGNTSLWWEVTTSCREDDAVSTFLKQLPLYDCSSGIIFYTFNDKKFPSTWTFLTGGGIIGLYTTFVLLASRFLKNFLGGQTRRIMYEDVPNVDRVLQLCLDIYLVREALEFMLEEDLFAKLIFLYRSPETMIKWTRPREEIADDETDSDSVRSRMSGRRNEYPQHVPVQ